VSLARRYPRPSVGIGSSDESMDLTTVIETRPGVPSGKPCFVGTRIAVYDVLEYLAAGMTTEEIVADFPELTSEHVRAAMEFAAVGERRLATPAVAGVSRGAGDGNRTRAVSLGS
jgi:uncharacterized protein (DUF433 family)